MMKAEHSVLGAMFDEAYLTVRLGGGMSTPGIKTDQTRLGIERGLIALLLLLTVDRSTTIVLIVFSAAMC